MRAAGLTEIALTTVECISPASTVFQWAPGSPVLGRSVLRESQDVATSDSKEIILAVRKYPSWDPQNPYGTAMLVWG